MQNVKHFGSIFEQNAIFEKAETDWWLWVLFKGKGSDVRRSKGEVVLESFWIDALEEGNMGNLGIHYGNFFFDYYFDVNQGKNDLKWILF